MTIYLRDYYPDVSISFRRLASGPLLVLFCLAPHGVYRASFIAVGAVGLPRPFTPTLLRRSSERRFVFCDTSHCQGLAPANLQRLRAACRPVGVPDFPSRLRSCNPTRGHPQADPKACSGSKKPGARSKAADEKQPRLRLEEHGLWFGRSRRYFAGATASACGPFKQRQRFFTPITHHFRKPRGRATKSQARTSFMASESV